MSGQPPVALMIRTIASALLVTVTMSALPAEASEKAAGSPGPNAGAPARIGKSMNRPVALPALYISYAALQGYDVYSTRQALARDAREANPLMQGVVGNLDGFVAVKAVLAVNTIIAADRLWRTNKTAAIAVMIASNSVAAIVAARNAHALHRLR